MSLSMSSLLIHNQHVPASVRAALKAAHAAPANERTQELQSAARLLFEETSLDCADVRELVDLAAGDCD